MVSPSSSAAVSSRPCVSTTPITTSSPCARSRCACASIASFPTPAQAPKKIFNFPGGAGRLFQQAIRIRTQGFVVHFALCPCSASSARLSSTIFTTGCPRKAPAACAYILQPVARPVQREAGEPPPREVAMPRRRVSDYYPARLPRPSPAQPEPRNSHGGLAARSAATQACIAHPVRDCWRRVASARRQWIIRRIGGGGGPAMKIARGGKRLSDKR